MTTSLRLERGGAAPPIVSSSGPAPANTSLQHLFFSLRFDWRYDLWLAVKFLPFALWTGFVVDRRPTALPYLMVLHALIDVTLPVLLVMVARGMSLS